MRYIVLIMCHLNYKQCYSYQILLQMGNTHSVINISLKKKKGNVTYYRQCLNLVEHNKYQLKPFKDQAINATSLWRFRSIPGQSQWDLWCTKWHWGIVFKCSQVFSSGSSHQCSRLIHSYTTNAAHP